jgi:hypothetical protein
MGMRPGFDQQNGITAIDIGVDREIPRQATKTRNRVPDLRGRLLEPDVRLAFGNVRDCDRGRDRDEGRSRLS